MSTPFTTPHNREHSAMSRNAPAASDGADLLAGTSADDTIDGLGGNDTITGLAGSDALYGGRGDDSLDGGVGDDRLYGGGGNDTLSDSDGSDLLDGGAGSDRLIGASFTGQYTLVGGAGRDYLSATGTQVSLDGGTEDDHLSANGFVYADGYLSFVQDGSATLTGGDGDDILNANGYARSSLSGGDGNDSIGVYGYGLMASSLPGSATLSGGAGDDYLAALSLAHAELSGGDGADYLSVSDAHSAVLAGDVGSDTLVVDASSSVSEVVGRIYTLDGGADDDILEVRGANAASAGQASVSLWGGAGNDTLSVRDDWAGSIIGDGFCGTTIAALDGGEGDDTLRVDGVLQAVLTGGAGADNFVLTSSQYRALPQGEGASAQAQSGGVTVAAEPVVITDFTAGAGGDLLDVTDLLQRDTLAYHGDNPFAGGFLVLEQAGADTLLRFDADGSAATAASAVTIAVLRGVTATALVADNFSPGYAPDGAAVPGQAVTGSDQDESLSGGPGNDTLNGRGGADALTGQSGSDALYGDDGDDSIDGGLGDDSLYGGEGNDVLTDEQGANLLDGGAGNDYLGASGVMVSLDGGDDDDSLAANGWEYLIDDYGCVLIPYAEVQSGVANLAGGTGSDLLWVNGYATSRLDGGTGDDFLTASGVLWIYRPDLFDSTIGYPQYGTHPMATTLLGGAGSDHLSVDSLAQAELSGGDGADDLSVVDTRSAALSGGAGEDQLVVSFSAGFTEHTDGDRRVNRSYTLDGGGHDDILDVTGVNPVSDGQTTATLLGGSGDDRLSVRGYVADGPGAGPSYGIAEATLDGGVGADTLRVDGVLRATLTGGTGVDTFTLTAQQYRTLLEGARTFAQVDGPGVTVVPEAQVITDFTAGAGGDLLDFTDLLRNGALGYAGGNPFADGFLVLEQAGADTLLRFDADGAVATGAAAVTVAVLHNVAATALTAGNFPPGFAPDGSPAADQTLGGSRQAETLGGGLGDDTLNGLNGADTLFGQAGSDRLFGGNGNDFVDGGFGNDSLYGGDGDDVLVDDQGDNLLDGGAGNDSLSGSSLTGRYTLLGGAGRDTLEATGAWVNLDGGAKNDSLVARGKMYIDGFYDFVQDGVAALAGGTGNDELFVECYVDVTLDGGAGNDDMWASDVLHADLSGGDGNDHLYTYSARSATLAGGAGADYLHTSIDSYSDHYMDGERSYLLDGGDDDDHLDVQSNEFIHINMEGPVVYWYTSATLRGGLGNDTLTVGAFYFDIEQHDRVIATASLDGGEGDDTLRVDNALLATVTGGAGADCFVLTSRHYYNLLGEARSFEQSGGSVMVTPEPMAITDFTAGVDVLDCATLLNDAAPTYTGDDPFATGLLHLEQSGADTLLRFDPDGVATAESAVTIAVLGNVTAADLGVADFVFSV